MSVPVGAFTSKSRLITLSSCSRLCMTDRSSSGTKFDGNTIRPWRLTRNGCMECPFVSRRTDEEHVHGSGGRYGGSVGGRPADAPLDGADEVGPELTCGNDRVDRADCERPFDVVNVLELS